LPGWDWAMKTICLIDDSADFVFLIEMMLRPHYKLMAFASGAEGIAYLQKNRCDLLILDYHLPDIGGQELLDGIRKMELNAVTPAILISAKSREELLMEKGFCGIISKPVKSQAELLKTIKKCLGDMGDAD
jgi:CheY-like chemotaxis protein